MEPNRSPEVPLLGVPDSGSNNRASLPLPEDIERPDDSQNAQSTDSSEPLLDPSLQRGRSHLGASDQTQRAARQFNQSRTIVPKPPTTNLSLLIFTAVATCQKKSGLSMQALKKIVTNMGYDMAKKKHYFLRSIKSMVAKGQLWQVKGTGATGSFKVNPDLGKKKHQPKVRGRGRKAKDPTKKKSNLATPRNGRSKNKRQGKAESSKRAPKRSRMPTIQAAQNQVKVGKKVLTNSNKGNVLYSLISKLHLASMKSAKEGQR
uniref:H15 domain-containing protein n=1 Tax=Varanus komodoensis TaxID=61221 RepID=A0A8D2J1H8_VARKO